MDSNGFVEWLGSGWGDALKQWEHPIDSVKNSFTDIWAGFTGQTNPNAEGYTSGAIDQAVQSAGNLNIGGDDSSSSTDTGDDSDSTFGFSTWQIVLFVLLLIALLFGTAFLLKEAREI